MVTNSIAHLFIYFTHKLRHVLHVATDRKVENHTDNKDYLCNPNIFSNHKRSDGVYGAQRNYTSIPFKAKPFLSFVGKSPSLVLEISEKIETIWLMIPNPGKMGIYNSGWPKNQRRR